MYTVYALYSPTADGDVDDDDDDMEDMTDVMELEPSSDPLEYNFQSSGNQTVMVSNYRRIILKNCLIVPGMRG